MNLVKLRELIRNAPLVSYLLVIQLRVAFFRSIRMEDIIIFSVANICCCNSLIIANQLLLNQITNVFEEDHLLYDYYYNTDILVNTTFMLTKHKYMISKDKLP